MSNFVKNSALYLVATIILKATSFLLLPLYSNLIPPEGYGKVYIVSSITAFLSLVYTFSLQASLQRYFFNCKNEAEVKKMYSVVLFVVLVISSISTIALLFFSAPVASWLKLPGLYYRIAIYTVFLSTFYHLIVALLYAKQEAVKISLASIGIGVSQIVIQLVLVLTMEEKATAVVYSIFISGVLQFVLAIAFSIKYIDFRINFSHLREYIVYGLSQLPSDLSTWIVSFFDRVILNRFHDSSAVGIYGMGNTFASIPNVLFQSMNKALVPVVFEDYKKNEGGNVAELIASTTLIERIFVIITTFVTILLVFSKDITHIFLAKSYEGSAIVMFLVMIACLVDIYRILFMNPMAYNVRYVKIKSLIWVLASASSIGLNLILIPKYSYLGACASLIIVNVTTCLLILYFSHKAIPVPYKKRQLIEVLLVSAVFSLCFFIERSWWFFGVKIVLGVVYAFVVLRIYPIPLSSIVSLIKRKK